MSVVLQAAIIGLLAGAVGTAIGGAIGAFTLHPGRRFLGATLGFAAGIMLAVVTLDLLPEAIDTAGALPGVGGMVLGVALIASADRFLPHHHPFSADMRTTRFLRAGVVIGLGITLHNLPEGLAIGAGLVHQTETGMAIAVAIAIHNIPEGLAMAVPLRIAGVRRSVIIAATFVTGLPMALGAVVGSLIGAISPVVLSVSLGVAAGAMLFITADELIPSANSLAPGHLAAYGTTVGLITGLLVFILIAG